MTQFNEPRTDLYLSGQSERKINRVGAKEIKYLDLKTKLTRLCTNVWADMEDHRKYPVDVPPGYEIDAGEHSKFKITKTHDQYTGDRFNLVMTNPWPAKPDHYETLVVSIPSPSDDRTESLFIARHIGHKGEKGTDSWETTQVTEGKVETKFDEGEYSSRGKKIWQDEMKKDNPNLALALEEGLAEFTITSDNMLDPGQVCAAFITQLDSYLSSGAEVIPMRPTI